MARGASGDTRPVSRSAVLFDVGDTLVRRPTVGPGRRIAAALGLGREEARAITRWLFREPFASPGALAARLRAEFAPPVDVEEAVATIWHAQEEEPVEVDGATACVAAARDAGARIGIVSNIWAPYEAGFRRACPAIVPLVDSWHVSYRAGTAKPNPALFQAALRALDVDPRHAMMIGDSIDKDVTPALALGMRAVWVPATGEGAETADDAVSPPSAPPGAIVAADLHAARAAMLEILAATG